MADKKYKINFEMTDGSVESVEFTVPQGENSNILIVTEENDVASHSASEICAAVEAGKTVFYRLEGVPVPLYNSNDNKVTFASMDLNTKTGGISISKVAIDNEKTVTMALEVITVYSKTQIDSMLGS